VVFGVVAGIGGFDWPPANDSARTPITGTGCFYGIFAVVASLLGWEQTLPITKNDSIFLKGERPALMDKVVRFNPLWGQLVERDAVGLGFGDRWWRCFSRYHSRVGLQ
jgi:hypothetical protein